MTGYKLESAGVTDVGLKRSANEDAIFMSEETGFWVVADGMGGHENGSLASQTTVEGFAALQIPEPLDAAITTVANRMYEINDRLGQMSVSIGGQMGTTVVALLVRGDRFAAIWVGDSRAYIYRRGGLFQLTVDHTHVQDLVDEGLLTAAQAIDHPMGHVLTRAMGVQSEIQVDVVQDNLEPGDRFLLCSDGLTGPVDDEHLRRLITENDPQQISRNMVAAAYENGAPDNISVIVIMTEAGRHV